MPSPSSIINPFSSPSPGILTRSATVSVSPTVIDATANRMAESYSYGGGSNNNSSWLSGLRAKLTGMSEWLTQLGVGNNKEEKMKGGGKDDEMIASSSTSSSYGPGEGYDEDTGFSFQSIRLDDCTTVEINPLGWMDLDGPQCWNDTLDRQHFGPLKDLLTIGGSKRGTGHEFSPVSLLHPTWCDKCGDFIWGFRQQASKCSHCSYTCHERCIGLVTLDCRSASASLKDEADSFYPYLEDGTLGTIPTSARIAMRTNHSTESAPCPDLPPLTGSREGTDKENRKTSVSNPLFHSKSVSATVPRSFAPTGSAPTIAAGPRKTREPSAPPLEELEVHEVYVKEDTPFEAAMGYKDIELEKRITEYNKHVEHGFEIEMAPSGDAFTGCLQIHMNFTRPINIVAGERPPTVYDVVNTAKSSASLRTITSFFLPRNTVKTVAINSEMTTRQMIVVLLRKFKVADNPRKFALYECSQSIECQTLMRKFTRVPDSVCPLRSALGWSNPREKCFVLQENDAGEILWDAFEVPELQNFLRILGLEEQQYRTQIKEKYRVYDSYLIAELRAREQEGYEGDFVPREFAPPPPSRDYDSCSSSSSMVRDDDRHIYATVGDEDDDFGTMRPADYATARSMIRNSSVEDEPMYVNIREMGDSTKL
ncbi:hypothetical protein PENTCL1PPCAC_19393 [Pristionchus entomophagus]|uniref:Uncharacterized protein n=1 Tax=Pristionchus entomophagus TaxID=358040 RepID=A0AAV5TT81_9BILA|nr:hypothetical protein PENTCL1PPCAC_19393 [Pristionchus entomophagus]